MLTKDNIWKTLIVLSILGIFLATYLFYNFLTKPIIESCYVNSSINCDAITKGPLATLFGIPVSLIGLTGYIVILFSSFIKNSKLLLAMSSFGMVFCLSITIQEVFGLRVICPVCLLCQIDMFIVFLLALKLNRGFKKSKQ